FDLVASGAGLDEYLRGIVNEMGDGQDSLAIDDDACALDLGGVSLAPGANGVWVPNGAHDPDDAIFHSIALSQWPEDGKHRERDKEPCGHGDGIFLNSAFNTA